MGVQAAGSNNLRALTPSPTKSVLQSNYLNVYDYTNQFDLSTHNELLMSKGRNSMTGFLDLMGMKESFQADKYTWAEEGELHKIYTGVARTSNTFTITAHSLQTHAKVSVQDPGGDVSEAGLVSAIIDADTVTILARAGAAWTGATTALTVYTTGSEHPKGSDGADVSTDMDVTYYSNKPIIEKTVHEVSGSDDTNILWFKTDQGWFWTDYNVEKMKERWDDELEVSCLTSEKSDAASLIATTLNLNGAEGLFPALKDRGNVFDGIITDLADWDAMIKRNDLVHAEKANYFFCNREQDSAVDSFLGTLNAHDTDKANYGIFENGEAMALNLSFRGFHKGGYDFFKQRWSALINPLKLGNAGNADSNITNFVTMPNGETNIKAGDYDSIADGQGSKDVPYITLMYKSKPGEDRFYKEWVTGSVGLNSPTNSIDSRKIDMLTERSLRVAGAENMWIGVGA
jgi:hypothetical protein